MGYTLYILATMFVLPILSVIVERRRTQQPVLELIGTWFIFWGVGVRLLVAGVTQIINPDFTGALLQLDSNVVLIIQELGFSNVLLALVAVVSLWKPGYRVLGTAGAVYMGFAGVLHLANHNADTTFRETVALWSDLWIFGVACVYLVYAALRAGASVARHASERR